MSIGKLVLTKTNVVLKISLAVAMCATLLFSLLADSGIESVEAQTASPCSNGIVVPNPSAYPGLVSDCEALLEARAAWSRDSALNWSAQLPITSWHGVHLGGGQERVEDVGLAGWGLNGEFPSALGRLSALTLMSLGGNGLSGRLPPEIGRLTNLRNLNLGSNDLSGDLPPQMRNLSKLRSLDLSGNSISGITPLAGMNSLQFVDLNRNRISNLAPLAANAGLGIGGRVDVTRNPLDEVSVSTHIPRLQAKGVNVLFDDNLPYEGPQVYNENIVVLPVARIGDPDDVSLETVASRFYQYFMDELDFLIVLPNLVAGEYEKPYAAYYQAVRNDIGGIGERIYSLNWQSTNRLQGVVFFDHAEPQFLNDPEESNVLTGQNTLLHELTHRWGNYILPTSPHGGPFIEPHWAFSSVNGVLGGFDIANLVDHGGGRYSAGDFGLHGNLGDEVILSPFELYLAGFITADEVPDLWVALDGKSLEDESGNHIRDSNGYFMFMASQIRTYAIEDIIAEHGHRTPSVSQAQKSFHAAVVLLVDDDRPANLRLLNSLSGDADRFSHPGNSVAGGPTFYEATGGRGTITMDGLSRFRKDSFPVEAPFRPMGLVARANDQLGIDLSWSAPPIDGGSAITTYDLRYIERSADKKADSNWTIVEDVWTGSGRLEYTLTKLSGGAQYDVQVRAVNSAGEGYWSVTAAVTSRDSLIAQYDTNNNGTIEKSEVIRAINDYLYGEASITKADVIWLINLYLYG